MAYTTVLLQRVATFQGTDLAAAPSPLEDPVYPVPQGCTAGVQYVRAGNTPDGMALVTLLKNSAAMRLFPVESEPFTYRSPSWTA
ncbi:hypothetical protein [Rubrobacter indicoceani]|uniref:hypothetical protein n=1 Tax=Rubrobacter indicoceani TaxID=2051957 RepID=UPI000E5AD95E|nr:hypothetical protein [Rubrobacter indicoceani]